MMRTVYREGNSSMSTKRCWRCLGALLTLAPLAGVAAAPAAPVVVRGAHLYTAPDAPRVEGGVVVMRGARIGAAGSGEVAVPRDATAAPCGTDGTIVAGFQNSHVHFIGEAFAGAARQPAASLQRALETMLPRHGYTTVVETASFDPANSFAMRARIERGEVRGSRILTVGLPLFPPRGIPFYLSHFPEPVRARMPQPDSADAAVRTVDGNMAAGAEATKLFIATPVLPRGTVRRMPAEVALAASRATHRRGGLTMAHPTGLAGVRAAIAARVDILVHFTLDDPAPWPADVMRGFLDARMAMVPTLKLLRYELAKEQVPPQVAAGVIDTAVQNFGRLVAAGGRVLFGTDVGYMTDDDPTEEYALMQRAGMSPMAILAALTTAPAEAWGEGRRRGKLQPGMDADVVVLDADPVRDARNFAKVRCVFRQGALVYRAAARGAAPQR
jgi:imidazolonepropionase-like amidohydrolase